MIKILNKLDYDYYYKSSLNLFKQNGLKDKLLPLECSKEEEEILYHANFFNRTALDYFLVSPNIYHLNKLSTTLFNYYSSSYKDIMVIPYDASIDAYTKMNWVLVMYFTKMMEKYLTEKEIKEYRKEAEKDHVFDLSEELNIMAYFRHAMTKINEKQIKILFIVNNAHLIHEVELNFTYNRRETFVRYLLTSNIEPTEIYDEAKIINFNNKYNDVYVRSDYIENELEKKLGILEKRKFIDTYRRYDISYIDVLVNIINNLDDEDKIKKVIANKNKINDALDFMNLLISTTPTKYKCYTILPFIFASPLGINNETLKEIFKDYKDDSLKDNIEKLMALLPSIIYQDLEKNYRLYDNVFINEIREIYAFDIFHASNILLDKIDVKTEKNMVFAINFLYYAYRANRKDALSTFISFYLNDPQNFAIAFNYILISYEDKARDYLRNYLHLLSDEELTFILFTLYEVQYDLDLANEYLLTVLDRIRQIAEDRLTASFSKDRMFIYYYSLYFVGNMEGHLGRELNRTMYHFHALIYSHEYQRLYKEVLFDEEKENGAELALEYSKKIVNDKIDKKVRLNLYDNFDSYDLRINKYLDLNERYNAKEILLELLNSYSFNLEEHTLDIIEYYQSFNFHLEINDTLMFYYLYQYIKGKNINSKIIEYIKKKYLDEFKA